MFYSTISSMATGFHFVNKSDNVTVMTDYVWEPADVAVILWSPKMGETRQSTNFRRLVYEQQQEIGKKTLIIEQPIIRDTRSRFFRIGFDHVTRMGEFGVGPNSRIDSNRWNDVFLRQQRIKIHPWKDNRGNYIIVVGQYPNDFSLNGINFYNWVQETVQNIKRVTNRPIIFKPHPKALKKFPLPELDVPIMTHIPWESVWATVSYNSGMAVDSVMCGIPAITLNEGSWAWDVAQHSIDEIETPTYFDRTQWLYKLSYTQWQPHEIYNGLPWKRLRGFAL